MAMLFSIAACIFSIKYIRSNKITSLLTGAFFYSLALLSKENSITFLAIIPLTYYIFTDANKKQYIIGITAFLIPAVLFMYIRSLYAPTGIMQESAEILNNPFTLASTGERYATIVMTWLSYIKLLFVPLPLTHDYFYNQVPYVTFFSIKTILSIIVTSLLLVFGIKLFLRKNILGYGILFYFITFSIVSNLLFSVGVLMSERFLFMPSLGFCIALAYLLYQLVDKNKLTRNRALILLVTVSALFTLKTFTRNFDWKNNFTLLQADVKSSPNSTKLHASLGAYLAEEAEKTNDPGLRNEMLEESIDNLNTALTIYPKNSGAWLILGNTIYKYKKDLNKTIDAYQKSILYKNVDNIDAVYNLAIVQLENNMPAQAKETLLKANVSQPGQYKYLFGLGEVYAHSNLPDSAVLYYKMAIQLKPNDGNAYHKTGITYGMQMNRIDDGLTWLNKAVELDPANLVFLEDLAVANGIKGNADAAINTAQKIIQIDPGYIPAYHILSTSYLKKRDTAAFNMYEQKAKDLQAGK